MKILSIIVVFLLSVSTATAQSSVTEEQSIRDLLNQQIKAWNSGSIEGFMQTYWKSDSLMFIGKNGVQRGWQTTLDNYKRSYPDKAAMGTLSFELIEVRQLSPEYYYVVGKWMLTRTAGNLSGHYDLLMRKINGHWLIVSDHSS